MRIASSAPDDTTDEAAGSVLNENCGLGRGACKEGTP